MLEWLECDGSPRMLEADFARYLRGGDLGVDVDEALVDEQEDDEENDDKVFRRRRVHSLGLVATSAVREINEFKIGDVQIHFDNFSHSSGKRRCYAACRNPEHLTERWCGRYRTLEGFGTGVGAWRWWCPSRPVS